MSIATSPLDRLLERVTDCLTPEVAAKVVALRADESTQTRLDELADKANEGTLTDAEQSEYAEYVRAIDVIAILQAKARALLRKTS